jgi:hypothetical protein
LLAHGDLNFVILYDYTFYVYVLFYQSGKETQATHIFEIFKKTKVEDLKDKDNSYYKIRASLCLQNHRRLNDFLNKNVYVTEKST